MGLERIDDLFRLHLGIDPSRYVRIPDDPDSMVMRMEDERDLSFSQYFYKFLDRSKVPVLSQQRFVAKDYPVRGLAMGYMHSLIMGKLEFDEGGCVFEHEAVVLPFRYRIDRRSRVPEREQLEEQLKGIILREEFLPWQPSSILRFSQVHVKYRYLFLDTDMLSQEYLDGIRQQQGKP